MSAVKSNRKNVNAESLTGKVYLAEQAQKMGLIDEIGRFDVAVERLAELIDKNKPKPNNTKNMANFNKMSAVIGVEAIESTSEGLFLSMEQAEAIETALENIPEPVITNEIPQEVSEQLSTATGRVTELETENSELKEQINVLKSAAGTDPAKVVTETEILVDAAADKSVDNEAQKLYKVSQVK